MKYTLTTIFLFLSSLIICQSSSIVSPNGINKVRAEDNQIIFDLASGPQFSIIENANGAMRMQLLSNVHRNTFIGNLAGQSTVPDFNNGMGFANTFIGTVAGRFNKMGSHNTYMGYQAGTRARGSANTIIGSQAGNKLRLGIKNTFIGNKAGAHVADGSDNVQIGISAGNGNQGDRNVFIGNLAGHAANGDGNICIGHASGQQLGANSNKLYIDNSNTSNPLIYGEFDTNFLKVNGKKGLQVNHGTNTIDDGFVISNSGSLTNAWRFHVVNSNGDLELYSQGSTMPIASIDGNSGTYTSLSDQRYKKNIMPISSVLQVLLAMDTYKYNYITQENEEEKYLGVLAQDLKLAFPELVSENDHGVLHVDYSGLTTVLLKGLQEQQDMIEAQQNQISEMAKAIEDIRDQLKSK